MDGALDFLLAAARKDAHLYSMKATLEIPDDLYRNVKARSALEGRSLRSVAEELFRNWLASEPSSTASGEEAITEEEIAKYPWLVLTRKHVNPSLSHDMEDIRNSIARGRAGEFGAESTTLVTFEKGARKLPQTLVLEG